MIKLTDWIPHIGFIPKEIPLNLFLDHFRFRKTQEDLELDNPVSPNFAHADNPRGASNTRGTCNIIPRRPGIHTLKLTLEEISLL